MSHSPSVLEQTRARLRELVEQEHLPGAQVSVLARPLTPEEAIGTPGRRDFPIVVGKERVVEARVLGARGHAFTDSPREFVGTVGGVLALELSSNWSRAVFVATGNAVLRHLGLVTATVHCRDDDPELCAAEIAARLLDRHGRVEVGLVGLNPAIAERLVETFGAEHVHVSDLCEENVGQRRAGVAVLDGRRHTGELVDASDVVLITGTTLVNGTFDAILARIRAAGKPCLVYGVTAAGVCALTGIERICPRGGDG